jgi:hypothetical protein
MNNLNLRKLSLIIGIVLICAGGLACQIPGVTGKPVELTVVVAHDPNLVAVWREARRIGEGGQLSQPSDPLLIGFFDDGTFKAVFDSHRFETYHDFWGEWRAEGDSLTLTITGGNNLPSQSTYRGRYEVQENELVLHGIVLVDDFAGPTTVFSYERPAPDGKVI